MTWEEIGKIKPKLKELINTYIKTGEVYIEPSGRITFYVKDHIIRYSLMSMLVSALSTSDIQFALMGDNICFVIQNAQLDFLLEE